MTQTKSKITSSQLNEILAAYNAGNPRILQAWVCVDRKEVVRMDFPADLIDALLDRYEGDHEVALVLAKGIFRMLRGGVK